MRATPSADASAALLAALVTLRQGFVYARIGDGDVYCAFGLHPYGDGHQANTNGEYADAKLPVRVANAIRSLASLPMPVYFGDYLSRAPGAEQLDDEWREMRRWLRGRPMLHVESLLLHRRSQQLAAFYQAIAADDRRKLYVAPEALAPAAAMLGAQHLCIPQSHAYQRAPEYAAEIRTSQPEVVLYSAGYATKLMQAAAWAPQRVQIDLGSALDPVFIGPTRTGQLIQAEALAVLEQAVAA